MWKGFTPAVRIHTNLQRFLLLKLYGKEIVGHDVRSARVVRETGLVTSPTTKVEGWEERISSSVAKLDRDRFTVGVQLDLVLTASREVPSVPMDSVCVGSAVLPLRMVRNRRARRYILRLCPDGTARVTIPRGGSIAAGKAFVRRQSTWLERQVERFKAQSPQPGAWVVGSRILFRGEQVRIEERGGVGARTVRFGTETLLVKDPNADLRPAIEKHLWQLAAKELPPRLLDYAALHDLRVARVTVRNQRTRWGSCSQRGCVSLNWRLIQTPPFVRDYICLHELMHLREMNHSRRFWTLVESVCPYYRVAERWLKAHARLLR